MRGLHVAVDRRVSFPLVHKPVTDTKFEPELFHVNVVRVEMLVVHHAGRNMDRVALLPLMPLAADLRIATPLQGIEIGLRVRMAVALGVRQINKDRADRRCRSLEAVLFSTPSHQKIGGAVLGLGRALELLLVHGDPPAVGGPVLRLFRRRLGEHSRIIRPRVFDLLYSSHIKECFERPRQA